MTEGGMLVEEGTPFKPDQKMREHLEKAEIEAPGCVPGPEVYARLLAVYLYENDLCSAKFLWKRIPETLKGIPGSEDSELAKIWDIGKALWTRDMPKVFKVIEEGRWSDNVSAIVAAIKDRVRQQSLDLVGSAYTSIKVSDFSRLVGCPIEAEAVTLALAQPGWTLDSDKTHICPERKKAPTIPTPAAEEQLDQLTQFVAFLEK